MKAKEIVSSIRQKLDAGEDAHQVLSDEIVADVHRMRSQNEERKGQSAALLRLLREYNQKWNSVIAQLNLMPEFQQDGQAYLKSDDFCLGVLHSIRDNVADIESEKAMILGTRSITNMTLHCTDWRRREADRQKLASSAANDPAIQALKTLLGL